jgi:plasmid maintenance system antidote protein VapI
MAISQKTLSKIVNDRGRVTSEIVMRPSSKLGSSVRVWCLGLPDTTTRRSNQDEQTIFDRNSNRGKSVAQSFGGRQDSKAYPAPH